ncbi:MAG: arginase family protein [Candidatus Diapherotrites archaeon]|nr:arginase family protein [Candidatus Diapherotrites archaeon]
MPLHCTLNKEYKNCTFLDAEKNPSFEEARAVFLGVSFDATTTYHKGADKGPQALLEASHQIEFEPVLDSAALNERVCMHNAGILEFPSNWKNGMLKEWSENEVRAMAEGMVQEVQKACAPALHAKKFLLMAGGEHSVANGIWKALAHLYNPEGITLLHVDAHLDLRDAYWNQKYCHGSVMARAKEMGFQSVHTGIRDQIGVEEQEQVKKYELRERIFYCATQPKEFYARNARALKKCAWMKKENLVWNGVLNALQMKKLLRAVATPYVWISLDVDGFDSSVMPGTGTPLPYGMSLKGVEDLLHAVIVHARSKKITVLGMDLTELAPLMRDPEKPYSMSNAVSVQSEMNAALLAHKVLQWMFT